MLNDLCLSKKNSVKDLKAGRNGPMVRGIERLTPRQREILQLLAQGFYYKEIGVALGISHCTVRAHLHSVYQRLEVKSRARAVVKFHEQFSTSQT